MELRQVYDIFKTKTGRQINADEKDVIIDCLQNIDEITTSEDAQMFLSLLKICRSSQTEMNGKGMMDAITTVFSSGDEGAYYENENYINDRFMYELIQNVDDCQYSDLRNCKLNIFFDIARDKIVLKYNELGFKPKNVVAISDLGNSTKNHKKSTNLKESNLNKSDFQEIGEKGIGFKSIFGLARKVTIKSGYFYFSFYRDNVLIPEMENYNNFKKIDGTELHLYLDSGRTKNLYDALKAKYHKKSAVMNENPVLFLNKLSEIRYSTNNDYFGFYVTRNQESENGSAIELKFISATPLENKSIKCYRFTKEIVYSVEECRSRYGQDEDAERKHKIEIIASANMYDKINGRIYSFFPTEQKLDAPIIVQAPFKLNSARTNIASENNNGKKKNLWFQKTKFETINFIHSTYEKLAKIVNEDIVDFIPKSNLVSSYKCPLYDPKLDIENIICLNIFQTATNKYVPYSKVCYLKKDNISLEDAKKIHKLLNINVELLNSINIEKFKRFDIRCITNVEQSLFITALNNREKTHECLKFIKDYEPISANIKQEFYINENQMNEFLKYTKLKKFINSETIKFIKHHPSMNIYLNTKFDSNEEEKDLKDYCLNNCSKQEIDFKDYIKNVNYFNISKKYSDIILCNSIVGNHILDSFSNIYQMLYPENRGSFFAFLKADEVEKEILKLTNDNSIDDEKYFYELKRLRDYQKKTLGKQYESILKIIKDSGTRSKRFFSEILQNIDDCKFVGIPRASFKINKTEMIVSYNEVGFTRSDIIALTAIGESTKKLIKEDVTGEKGIGFKSVFNVVDWVEVHSGNFHFKVFKNAPTVPEIIDNSPNISGTTMIFHFFDDAVAQFINYDSFIFENCLCLKRLKNVNINKKDFTIFDDDIVRILKYNGKTLKFYKFIYEYNVENQTALEARFENKLVNKNQKICYYVPDKKSVDHDNKYCIYSTFPTETKISVPLYIDANLNLNTSREKILEDDSWNKYTFEFIYKGYYKLLEHMSSQNYKQMLNLFPYKNKYLIDSKLAIDNVFDHIKSLNIFKIYNRNQFTNLYMGVFSEKIEYYVLDKWGRNSGNQLVHFKNNLIDFEFEHIDDLRKACGINMYPIKQLLKDLYNPKVYNAIVEQKMNDVEFRKKLYECIVLEDLNYNGNREINLVNWPIIPVKKNDETHFICYNKNIYYSHTNMNKYPAEIYFLDEKIMSKDIFNGIFKNISNEDIRIQAYSEDIVSVEFYKEIKRCFKFYNHERARKLLKLFNLKTNLFLACLEKKKDFEYSEILLESKNNTVISLSKSYIDVNNKEKQNLANILVKDEYVEFAKALGVKSIKQISDIDNLSLRLNKATILEFLELKDYIESSSIYKQILSKMITDYESKKIEGSIFFQLINIVELKNLKDINNNNIIVDVDLYCLKNYAHLINEIYIKYPNVLFELNKYVELKNLKNTSIIGEIKEDLSLRKESDSIKIAKKLLNSCVYCENIKVPMFALRKSDRSELLIINKKIYSEYDLLDSLKKYFLNYFRLSIDINREITRYTRDNYEDIISVEFDEKTEKIVTEKAKWLNQDDVEALKDFMCRPMKTKYGTFGGYAKRCPLCGSIVHTELTGMRLSDLKYEGYYFKIISCPNCYENLKYSKEVKFDVNKIKENKLSFECNINGYIWKVSDIQIRVGQKAILNVLNDK